jgi:hypothetical protein
MAFIVARIDGSIEEAYLAETEVLAEELIRMKVIQCLDTIINQMQDSSDPEVDRYQDLKHNVRGGSFNQICSLMDTDYIPNWEYHSIEPTPNLGDLCIYAKRNPCGVCSRDRECNEPRMPDVGMMQD